MSDDTNVINTMPIVAETAAVSVESSRISMGVPVGWKELFLLNTGEITKTHTTTEIAERSWHVKYMPSIAAIILLAVLIPNFYKQIHYASPMRVVYDAEGLLVPPAPAPLGVCEEVEQQTLRQCDQMMEETWADGGALTYQRKQHLKDFPRCQNLSNNIFQACNQYGK